MYTQRKEGLEKGKEGTKEMEDYVSGELVKLDEKLNRLIDITRIASEQYYETEEFANAYKVLVPAVNSRTDVIKTVVKGTILPAIIVEAFVFAIYIAAAFVFAIRNDNKKAAEKASGNDDDDDDDDNNAKAAEEKKAEEKSGDKKNSGKTKNNNK